MKTHEQFDKLAEQCYVKTGSVQTDHFDYVKFAELIVRECIDIVSPYAIRMENFDGGHPIDDLKKHFGVLE